MITWSPEDVSTLTEKYNSLTNQELIELFPSHTLHGIEKKARKLGLYKTKEQERKNRTIAIEKRKKAFVHKPYVTKKGYVMVYCPTHTRASDSGFVQEHILVFEKETGIKIPSGCCIHHINGNKSDNRISNLCLMTVGGHTTLHSSGRKMSALTKEKISAKTKERLKDKRNHPAYKDFDFSEVQALVSAGATISEACKAFGISKYTFYARKKELEC